MVNKLLKDLLSLKKKQIEALDAKDYIELSKLESDFQSQSKQFHIEPENITQDVVQDLHEINLLNNKLLKETSIIRDKSLKEILELKKGKIAIKAYSGKT